MSALPPVFQLCSPAACAALEAIAQQIVVPPGTTLTGIGSPVEGLWVVVDGLAEGLRPDADQAEWLPGTLLKAGDVYGTHVLAPDATNSVRFEALTSLTLFALPRADLAAVAQAHADVADLLEALQNEGLRRLLPLIAADDPPAARALLEVAGALIELPAGAPIPAEGLQILDAGGVRDGDALLGPGSLVNGAAWLLGVAPARAPVAETAIRLIQATEVPEVVRSALARRVTDDGGRLRRAPGPDPDQPWAPVEEAPVEDYTPSGRRPGPLSRLPFRRQRENMDCGAACLRMIHRYYGHPLTHRFAVRLARVSRYGTSLFDLAQAAERLGYTATGVQVEDWAGLRSLDLPAIAHVDGEHYVVVWRIGRRNITIGDPAHGRQRIGRDEFLERFGGALLLIRPTDLSQRLDEEADDAADEARADFTPRRLWPYVRPYRGLIVHVLLASILLQMLGLVVPFMTQVIIDRVLAHGEVGLLNAMLGGLIALAVMSGLVLFARAYLLIHGSLQIQRALLTSIYGRLLAASQRFFSRFTSGDLVRRLAEVDAARSFFVDTAISATVDVLMVLTYGAILFLLDPQLALVFCGVLAVTGVVGLLLAHPVRGHTFAFQRRMAKADTHVINALKGIEPVKALALERPFAKWYARLLLPGLENGRRAAHWSAGSAAAATTLDGINVALLLALGAGRVLDDAMTLGQMMAFLLLARQLTGPFLRLLGQWRAFQATVVSLYRVGDLLDEVPEGEQQARRGVALENVALNGEIELRGLTFRYEGDPKDASKQVLHDVDLHVRPGEVVGIVGRSGCGKSTLARLLLRFFEPTHGSIRFDGLDARDLHPEALRAQIGLVTQEAFLYQASVRENIACGREDVTDEAILRAVQVAGAYDFISDLPFGFDTQLGERGLQLSGGQQQRLVIARALCTDPRILIFDEATAALDPVIEAEIHHNLRAATAGRTTLIIAHRLHTLRHADRIVVLDRGRVVEQGPHAALMAQNGLYARMWNTAPDWTEGAADG